MNIGDRIRLCSHPNLREISPPLTLKIGRYQNGQGGMMVDRPVNSTEHFARCLTCGLVGEVAFRQ